MTVLLASRPSKLAWFFAALLALSASLAWKASADATASLGPQHGLAPLAGDQVVPTKLLPPGAPDPDNGPSDVIFPPQQITLRFNHTVHVKGQNIACKTCHTGAVSSHSAADRLLPEGTVCDTCHMTSHDDLAKVTEGDDESGKCGFCHQGYKDGDGNKVVRMVMPRANMVFDHQKHAARNIGCNQCHGEVQELELAVRDQLPRMKGCFGCHNMPDAARGQAASSCETCHLVAFEKSPGIPSGAVGGPLGKAAAEPSVRDQPLGMAGVGGRIRTMFPSGTLMPPKWLHNAGHTPDFLERHKLTAAADSQFCANCHKEEFCTDCHDGRVRPRNVHPSDYLNMHAVEARMATQKCTSCHREQSFCLGCHQRVGVSMSGPTLVRNSGRFHPPKEIWSEAPRKPGHHAIEAQRNLNACVSCHIERDCVVCHGGQGVGGGFNPHRAGFAAGCASAMKRNPRPCFVCHLPGDPSLSQCQ